MSTSPRIIFLEHKKDGTLTNALLVTLADPTSIYGIRRLDNNAVVIPTGTPTTQVGLGQYEFNIDSLDKTLEYEFFFKVIDELGNVQYVYGQIPAVTIIATGSDGPTIPASQIGQGIPVDLNNDGINDGYKYNLQGADGYYESFDLNNDGIIDAVDVGSPTPSADSFDSRGVRVGLGGNGFVAPQTNFNTTPDGVPDVPSPKGKPAQNGTFGGTFGFDGTSGHIPATGGHRTNRSQGDTQDAGYWQGISFKNLCSIPIGPRGQCFKDKAHSLVRVMLKDTDPGCQAFTDDEIDMYLEGSLWAFNARPTFTAFLWDHMQDRWLDIIAKGATVWALYAQSLIESGREFTITDNGISYTPPPVSDKIQSYASALLQHYTAELTEIKSNFKPLPAAVGMFSVLDISPSLRRLRHLREKKIY